MIVTIESKKPLNELNAEVWDNIFVDSVEKVEDIKNVNTIRINGVTCVPTKNTEKENSIEEIMFCIDSETKLAEKNLYEVELNLECGEELYDKENHRLDAEVHVDEDLEVECKYYYLTGNFLMKEKKKVYAKVDHAE